MSDENTFEREIRTTAVDFSFGELLNLHKDSEIVIRPEYQRMFRWTTEQRSRLIESIILGLPIPPIFLVEGEEGILELIDGLQRTSSVLQFLDHTSIDEPELTLTGCDILDDLNGHTFNSLPLQVRMKIKRTPIRATIINRTGDQFVKYEMFKRLNTGGSLLSAQEIRNCSSRMVDGGSEFYDAIQSMAQFPVFVTTISRLSDAYKEKKADEELVLRFFAVTGYRDKYKGNIEEWLDGLMEAILFREVKFDIDDEVKRFERVFNCIAEKLGDSAFTRFNEHGDAVGRLAPAYYEATVCAFDSNIDTLENTNPSEVKRRLVEAYSDDRFLSSTGPGANTITKLEERVSTVAEHLGS